MIRYQKASHIFQAKNWLISAWKLFWKKPLTWFLMMLIFIVFVAIGSSFVLGGFIVTLLLPVFAGGVFLALDKANRDEPISIESLFLAFKDKAVLRELITVGVIGVAAVVLKMIFQYLTGNDYEIRLDASRMQDGEDVYKQVSDGSLFTGIISWAWALTLFFGVPLVAIYRVTAISALKHSFFGVLFNFVPLFVFLVLTVLLTIISILPFGLGLLVLIPVLVGATYFSFKDIFAQSGYGQETELAIGMSQIRQDIVEQETQALGSANENSFLEADLKKSYQSIRFFRLIGMALVAMGVAIAAYTFYSLQMGINAKGEVISVGESRTNSSNRNGISYKPVFSFTDKQGKQRTAPTSYGSSAFKYPLGARVEISYNPDDFSTVRINSTRNIFYMPMFFWFFGGVLVWMSMSAKKNVDENGVPPRKSLFLKEGSESNDAHTEPNKLLIGSLANQFPVDSQVRHGGNNRDTKADESVELALPRKFTINFYDEYMHITLSWLGKKTVVASVFATVYIGFVYMFFFSNDATHTGSPLMMKLIPLLSLVVLVGNIYYFLATWLNRSHVFVSQNMIEIKHLPLPWFGNKQVATKDVKQLYSKREISNSSSGNETTVHHSLRVIGFDERDLTLLKVENSEQALFLEQEIEKYLGIKNLRVRGEIG